MTKSHAENIGIIVLALATYDLDSPTCYINDEILNMLDQRKPAHEVIRILADWSPEHAAGIVAQLGSED